MSISLSWSTVPDLVLRRAMTIVVVENDGEKGEGGAETSEERGAEVVVKKRWKMREQ